MKISNQNGGLLSRRSSICDPAVDFRTLAGCITVTPSTILQRSGGFGRRTSNIAGFERRSIDNAA
jgi:hypothetical protein